MKATINGITVEGTPQEITEFQRLQDERNVKLLQDKMRKWYPYEPHVPQIPSTGTGNPDYLYRPNVTCY